MSKPLPRRAVLGALALAPAAITVASVPALAAVSGVAAPDVHDLWRQALVARGEMHAAVADYDAAYDRLPWWVKPGLDCVNSEGEFCGSLSYEPARQDYTLPEAGTSVRHTIRPSERMFRKLFEHEAALWGEERMRPVFEDRMAKLAEREAAADRERERVGLSRFNEVQDAKSDLSCERDDAIRALDPTHSFDVLAAQIMVEAYYCFDVDETPDDQGGLHMAAYALRGLLPQITGDIATAAREIVEHPDRPLKAMAFARGAMPSA